MDKGRPLILIVEDEPSVVQVVRFSLKDNYDLIDCDNGDEACALCREKSPELILLDMKLETGREGEALLKRLREATFESIPIIAFTGYNSDEDRKKFDEMGFDGHVPKPYQKDDLLNSIRRRLP